MASLEGVRLAMTTASVVPVQCSKPRAPPRFALVRRTLTILSFLKQADIV